MKYKQLILITGATSGIGEALAYKYAELKSTLFLLGRNHSKLKEISLKCHELGAILVKNYQCDVTDRDHTKKIIDEIFTSYKLDIIICSAGISKGTSENINDSDREIINTNILGTMNIIIPAMPYLIKNQSGQIALFSSMAIYYSSIFPSTYLMTKEAMMSYARLLRHKLKKYNINISLILPGFVESKMSSANNYKKIGIISSEKAANIIVKKLAAKKKKIVFPKYLYYLSAIISRFI